MPPRIVVPLIGEPLPLDLVNTRPQPERGAADAFGTVEGLAQWLAAESDRLPHVRATDQTRERVVELRHHVGVAIDEIVRGGTPPDASIAHVNQAAGCAPGYPQLTWGGTRAFVETVRSGDDDARLLATLAEASIEYLASDLATRTKRCEAPDCDVLFLPTHPRRRWCSPTVCGNRTRVARYYQRHKDVEA